MPERVRLSEGLGSTALRWRVMMNEQLQGKLVEILASVQQATKDAGDFALEQLPDIASQYVIYGRIRTLVLTMFLLTAASALFATFRWAYKNPWNTSTDSWDKNARRSDSNYLLMIATAVLGGIFATIGVLSFDLMVWIAPKVWLLKELASMVR